MSNSGTDDAAPGPRSLLDGVEAEVAAFLGIKSIEHSLRALPTVDGTTLVRTVYDRVQANYARGGATLNKDRSAENWRWPSLKTEIADHNKSAEVGLERAIAKAAKALAPAEWGNQIPVASGLIAGAGDSRRAIDLVRRHAEGHFELIELKIASDTPLYAAIEILGYGCLWLLARADPPKRPLEMLAASSLDLSVLAPAAFYDRYDWGQFERAIDAGLRHLGAELGVDMSFRFSLLDPDIVAGTLMDGAPLLHSLAQSRPLHARNADVVAAFLPGVPQAYIFDRISQAGGKELESGKFASPESSAFLAANAFGWFVERPALLPLPPGGATMDTPLRVEIEYNARFPWVGGTHPWLDAAILTKTHLIGVESKRFEPFRDKKTVSFSEAYERHIWGEQMARYDAVRRALVSGALSYRHLDAAQLIKHAYGLSTEGQRLSLRPALFYIYAEPRARGGMAISADDRARHRDEIADFAARVAGDEVAFSAASYREWLAAAAGAAIEHRSALHHHFDL